MNTIAKGLDVKVIDWAFKVLLGLVTYLVQDMHTDIKQLREQIPAMKVEIDNLKDQELLKRFKAFKIAWYMKEEPLITYDSLSKTQTL